MGFASDGYEVIRGALTTQTASLLAHEMKILREIAYAIRGIPRDMPLGDEQVPNSFAKYGVLGCEALLLELKPLIEKTVGKELNPCYTYSRIYMKGAVLHPHVDRPSCEYSATVCLENAEVPWDIWLRNREMEHICVTLQPGDIIVYHGVELPHWREEYEHNGQVQTFLHYVDANGEYKDNIYDGRRYLGMSNRNRVNNIA